jgi:acetyl esterase/lipase
LLLPFLFPYLGMKNWLPFIFTGVLLVVGYDSYSQNVIRTKDIPYIPANSPTFDNKKHLLDIYRPKTITQAPPVIVFIHGGTWTHQSKNWYKFVGKEFAKHGFIAVIPNYRLSPEANYDQMMLDVTKAVVWAQDNSGYYGGDRNQVYIAGYSAGGHLAAMAALNKEFFQNIDEKSALKGVILIDPYGLELADILASYPDKKAKRIGKPFGESQLKRDRATPANFLGQNNLPFLILHGKNTVKSIKSSIGSFTETAKNQGHEVNYQTFKRKGHFDMGTMLRWHNNPFYDYLNDFVKK